MDLQPATPEHLAVIDSVCAEYRAMWSALRPPYECEFNGSRTDIDALDFIGYEAGYHPRGLFGAALIWGNVIAKTGLLSWLVSDSGDYMLGSAEYPRFLIWPMARTLEIEHTGIPQFGKYEWLMNEAICHCLAQSDFTGEEERRLVSLLDPDLDYGFLRAIPRAIERILRFVETS